MSVIDLATRVKLILDAVTSYELLDYIKFVEYTVSSQVGGESCQVIFNKILLFQVLLQSLDSPCRPEQFSSARHFIYDLPNTSHLTENSDKSQKHFQLFTSKIPLLKILILLVNHKNSNHTYLYFRQFLACYCRTRDNYQKRNFVIDWVRNSTKYPSLKLKVVIIRRLEIICWTFKTTSAA